MSNIKKSTAIQREFASEEVETEAYDALSAFYLGLCTPIEGETVTYLTVRISATDKGIGSITGIINPVVPDKASRVEIEGMTADVRSALEANKLVAKAVGKAVERVSEGPKTPAVRLMDMLGDDFLKDAMMLTQKMEDGEITEQEFDAERDRMTSEALINLIPS